MVGEGLGRKKQGSFLASTTHKALRLLSGRRTGGRGGRGGQHGPFATYFDLKEQNWWLIICQMISSGALMTAAAA